VKYYDYPDKRLFYKKEDGKALGTVITDSVTESTIPQLIACWDNMEILRTLIPEFYDLEWKKKVTDLKGTMYGK
jgi:hypothetical protein